jgi:hypothetical protein
MIDLNLLRPCGRCEVVIHTNDAEICWLCWYCQHELCEHCWDEYGHCGHKEADEINEQVRKHHEATDKPPVTVGGDGFVTRPVTEGNNMKYSRDDPKWVQADSVEAGGSGIVHVVAYGQRFEYCPVQWSNPYMDSSKSDVLVQNSQGDWLRVWGAVNAAE